jgi:hypothetical protein
MSFVWSSATTHHRYTTGADASFTPKTVFLGNHRAVNGRSVCRGDSGRDVSTERSASSDVANANDCESDYDEFPACRGGLAKFTESCHHGDSDWASDHDESAACRSDIAKFSNSCYHGDAGRGSDHHEFTACRGGLTKFTKPCHHGDSVRF